jgi:hypothetical protein
VPFERAGDGSGPARPYLRKLSSKALLYRCANSRAGMLRAGDCRRRPRTPWSSKCAGQVYVVGAGGVEPPSSSVSANYRNRCAAARFPRSRSTVGAEVKCSHSVQLNALLTRSSFTDTAPIIATSCSTPCLLHRALPAQTHSPHPTSAPYLHSHQHSRTNPTPHTSPFRSPIALHSYHPNPTHESSAPRRSLDRGVPPWSCLVAAMARITVAVFTAKQSWLPIAAGGACLAESSDGGPR